MIRNVEKLEAFHRLHERRRLAAMTYEDALRIFTALWVHARALGWEGPDDWLADLEPDLAVSAALREYASLS